MASRREIGFSRSSSCRRAVEKAASVFRSVGTKPCNLQCEAVIQIPADGTPGDDYTDQFTVCFTADGELVTGNRLVMPVMLPDVLVGVTKRNGS